uniref:hypothetical protein n=1 Tax=Nocardia suismassiliense TaxID=2077092 RepID=UPI003F49A4D8
MTDESGVTIDAFIRARLAEDEMNAESERELWQVEATREAVVGILEYTGMWELLVGSRPPSAEQASTALAEIRAIRAMAAVWRTHTDYQSSWVLEPF